MSWMLTPQPRECCQKRDIPLNPLLKKGRSTFVAILSFGDESTCGYQLVIFVSPVYRV